MAATASAAVVGFLTSSAFGLSWANASEAHSAQHVKTRIVIRLLQAALGPLPSASRSRTCHSRNRRHLLYFRTRGEASTKIQIRRPGRVRILGTFKAVRVFASFQGRAVKRELTAISAACFLTNK